MGPDNLLDGSGIDWANSDEQPTMLAVGGGTFKVYFDGNNLSWTLSSRDEDHKASNAASANSSSTKCQSNLKSASVSTEIEDEEVIGLNELMIYPNPFTDKVHIAMKDIEQYGDDHSL